MKKFNSVDEVMTYFINAQKQIINYIGNNIDRDVHLYALRKINEIYDVLKEEGLLSENNSKNEQINIYR